jgi:hypothetical protein
MFEHFCYWSKAVALICDIARGSATISLRSYSSRTTTGVVRTEITGWDHQQFQAYGRSDTVTQGLFSIEHLSKFLLSLSATREQFYAYEVKGAHDYRSDAEALLMEIQDIVITTVKLTVGDTIVCWFLVSLNPGRDTVHWKMRYEGRTARPGAIWKQAPTPVS